MNRAQNPYVTRWLDETYRGREDELVSVPQIAKMARVEPRTVNGWVKRYSHFPAPVKEVDSGPGPARYFVTTEVAVWLMEHRGGDAFEEFTDELDIKIAAHRRSLRRLEALRETIRAAREGTDTRE